MNAAFWGMVFLVPLLSVTVSGQVDETKAHLSGNVVDRSGGGIKNSRITLYEIGRDDPTAETYPNANGGKFEFLVKPNQSYRLVAGSVCMTPEVVEEVTFRSEGDTQLQPIILRVMNCDERQFAPSEPEGGIQLKFRNVPTAADWSRQAELMSLPLTRSAIDPRLLFPPVEFQPKVQGPRK